MSLPESTLPTLPQLEFPLFGSQLVQNAYRDWRLHVKLEAGGKQAYHAFASIQLVHQRIEDVADRISGPKGILTFRVCDYDRQNGVRERLMQLRDGKSTNAELVRVFSFNETEPAALPPTEAPTEEILKTQTRRRRSKRSKKKELKRLKEKEKQKEDPEIDDDEEETSM